MPTDLAEILADLRADASRSPRNDPTVAADARAALGRLRPALDRLRDDGLDTGATIDVDPDAFSRQADRVHWVQLLASSCDTLGRVTPAGEPPGRLTDLADAAAVAATLHADVLTSTERWAIVTALSRTAHHLTDAAAGGQESAEASRALIIAEASSGVLFQFAALDPPTAAGNDALHRPVPDPSATPISVADAALEASAGLVHATRPGTGPHLIAEILAIATAAETTCHFVGRAQVAEGDRHLAAAAVDAAREWRNVREQLRPFNDGSRRPQTQRPPAVDHAVALHRALRAEPPSSTAVTPHKQPVASMSLVLDRLATVAGRLDAAVADGVAGGRFMAYAVDLQVRDAWIRPFLEGRRATALVTAHADDVAPVRSALFRARAATAAAGLGNPAQACLPTAPAPMPVASRTR